MANRIFEFGFCGGWCDRCGHSWVGERTPCECPPEPRHEAVITSVDKERGIITYEAVRRG